MWHVRYEVLTEMKMSVRAFWAVMKCVLVGSALKMEAVCTFDARLTNYAPFHMALQPRRLVWIL
jgi:hypothetical protein